jgi:hypothetical protein
MVEIDDGWAFMGSSSGDSRSPQRSHRGRATGGMPFSSTATATTSPVMAKSTARRLHPPPFHLASVVIQYTRSSVVPDGTLKLWGFD